MSLPVFYDSPEEYFKSSVKFFSEYQYLFKTANTDILLHNILDKIDVDNLENDEVFKENFDITTLQDSNEFLKTIFKGINTLKLNYEEFEDHHYFCNLERTIESPVSTKKKHEIVRLTKEIKEICDMSSCEVVVDLGSGLGYLDQLLNQTTNLKVLGIEGNEGNYVGAKKRQHQYYADSIKNVKYVRHMISENSDKNIQEFLVDKFGISNFCITGLHACSDLTIDGMNLFLKMAYAKGLILMPCCYHKMTLDDSKEGRFKNFPLSECLKSIFEDNKCYEYMGVPFLRLACQPPTLSGGLEYLVFALLARATLQLYANRNSYKIKRKKRKAVRSKTLANSFSEYVREATDGFTLTLGTDELSEVPFDVEELESIWRETQVYRIKAAIFILFQRYLQPYFENFVLYDRLVYLKESGIENCYFKKIFNEKVSSKCLALISIKS